jgi:hypothetical protein
LPGGPSPGHCLVDLLAVARGATAAAPWAAGRRPARHSYCSGLHPDQMNPLQRSSWQANSAGCLEVPPVAAAHGGRDRWRAGGQALVRRAVVTGGGAVVAG